MALQKRKVGKNGPAATAIGLGCMSLSGVYGPSDEAAGERLIQQAVDLGVDFLDSSAR
jgi:aryl-alcohol dehydrogenase-like predicted oxidoreductase